LYIWTLAWAHARSGDRIAIADHADQNERDHQSLVDAVTSGRITAELDM
jgi:hypothetical protein